MCFDLNAAWFAAVLVSLALMSADQMLPGEREPRQPGRLRAGPAYVRTEPELLVPLLMVTVGPIVGWIGEELGGRWSLVIGGIPTVVVGLATYPVLARIDRQRAERRDETAAASISGGSV